MNFVKLNNVDENSTYFKLNNDFEITYSSRYTYAEINKMYKIKRIKNNNNNDCKHCNIKMKHNNCYRELLCGCTFHIKCIDNLINNDLIKCPKCLKLI